MKELDVIPHGSYCYTLNKAEHKKEGGIKLYTTNCPYYKHDESDESNLIGHCMFGYTDKTEENEILDMVKDCGINRDYIKFNGEENYEAN